MAITAAKTATLIQSYGADAVFHRDTARFDPATSTTTRTGAATQTVKAVEENRQYRVMGDADVLLYVSPNDLTTPPQTGGRVDYKGCAWTIVSVKPTAYQGATVLYEIGLKGTGQ